MAMANMNLIGVLLTKLWPVQALACGGGDGAGDGGGATKTIISPKFSNFGDILVIRSRNIAQMTSLPLKFNNYIFDIC